MLVYDAADIQVGRLASIVAKKLLEGERVIVINVEKALFLGGDYVIEDFRNRLKIKSHVHPRNTPRHPRRPDTIFRKVVRGMLPWKKPRGREAYKRLRVYLGVPPEYRNLKPLRFEEIDATKRLKHKWIYVGDLLKHLGWKGIVKY